MYCGLKAIDCSRMPYVICYDEQKNKTSVLKTKILVRKTQCGGRTSQISMSSVRIAIRVCGPLFQIFCRKSQFKRRQKPGPTSDSSLKQTSRFFLWNSWKIEQSFFQLFIWYQCSKPSSWTPDFGRYDRSEPKFGFLRSEFDVNPSFGSVWLGRNSDLREWITRSVSFSHSWFHGDALNLTKDLESTQNFDSYTVALIRFWRFEGRRTVSEFRRSNSSQTHQIDLDTGNTRRRSPSPTYVLVGCFQSAHVKYQRRSWV